MESAGSGQLATLQRAGDSLLTCPLHAANCPLN